MCDGLVYDRIGVKHARHVLNLPRRLHLRRQQRDAFVQLRHILGGGCIAMHRLWFG